MKTEVSDQKFPHFQPKVEAVVCYVEAEKELLVIQQEQGKTDEGLWGGPAGKIEPGETPEVAVRRELFEETGIRPSSPIVYLGTLYIRKPDFDYTYYMFQLQLDQKPSIQLSFEHSDYRWVKSEEIESLPLRPGVKEALHYYRNRSPYWLKSKKDLSQIQFRFAPAQASQRTLIHRWLEQSYIKQWIHGVGLQNTLNGIEAFFQGTSKTTYWIGYDQDIPFAFLITAPEGPDAIALDLFICHLNYLGKGFAAPMIRAFLKQHFSHVKKVLIDPEATNTRAIHVYKQVGFQITGEFIASWHPVPHYQMELNREKDHDD